MQLKQTRGSQGFGAPSAFSDAQNTTGKPVITVSKSSDNIYATVTEFFTTSKNEKKYLIHPTDIDSPFLHGTYIKLNYLNVRYVRGYVEKYIEDTAFMNPHVTIILIDPYGKEKIYRRLASSFPDEPKYAKPHPSSVNIGDLQDLITKSENKSVSAFLQDNFVRMSSKAAKQIVDIAERDLQDKLKLLILRDGFVNLIQKKQDNINFMTNEKRIYGRSDKPRDKLIIYQLDSEELKDHYWTLISDYNKLNKDYEKINIEIKKLNNHIEKTETQKEIKNIEREIKNLLKNIEDLIKQKDKIKIDLNILLKDAKEGLIELKKLKNRTEFEDAVNEVQISKRKPVDLTKEQFNSLFLAFKSIKYMAPPTDTAIPVGESTLENTLIKEIGLVISENVEDFGATIYNINQTSEVVQEDKKKMLLEEGIKPDDDAITNISIDSEDVIKLGSEILGTIDIVEETIDNKQIMQSIGDLLTYTVESIDTYHDVFDYFIENYTRDDDFVAAETRSPTSGKGLAYVVEAVMAYSRNIETPKRSRDILSRFVNRTPKLRDSADCAITKAVQAVNWKNYNLDTYDNSLPKGPIKLLVNVSGPFVHLMFKSQSKNALADDEDLIKEIKFCLEAIGRRLRIYLNRKASLHRSEKRASLIDKYIPVFVKSIYNIALQGESIHKSKLDKNELEDLMRNAIGKKPTPPVKSPVVIDIKDVEIKKDERIEEEPTKIEPVVTKDEVKKESFTEKTLKNWTKNELIEYCQEHDINLLSKDTKTVIIGKIIEFYKKPVEEKPIKIEPTEPIEVISEPITVRQKQSQVSKTKAPSKVPTKTSPSKPKTPPPKQIQTTLPIITTEKILKVLSNEWQTIKHLIFKLKIKDMMDARYLQLKLKELERKGQVLVESKMGKRQWKLK
jgi:DNA topoisomerase VI B subunit